MSNSINQSIKHNKFKPSLAENKLTLARGNDEIINGKQLVFSTGVFSS